MFHIEVNQDSRHVCLDFDLQGTLFSFHDQTEQEGSSCI